MDIRLEIRNIVENLLNEGKNPFEIMDYYLKSEPALIEKLKARKNALLQKLASLDIEYNPEKLEVGKIFPWILNLWKKGDSDINELLKSGVNSEKVIKFKNAQELFSKPSFRKSIKITDIQKFKNLKDFMDTVERAFIESQEIPSMASFGIDEINKDIKDGIIMKTNLSNNNFLVVSPLKKKGACKYGNTHINVGEGRWCTANEEHNAFDSYKDGILYIFMDKKDNLKSKYQFYYKKNNFQFNDQYNRPFDYRSFFDENIDVFEKLFPDFVQSLKTKKNFDIDNKQILTFLPSTYFNFYKENITSFSGPILNKMLKVISGEINPDEAFDTNDFGIEDGFEGYEADKKGIHIKIDMNNYNSTLDNFLYAKIHGYSAYEFSYDEFEYLQNYVNDSDIPLFLELIRVFKPSFSKEDFENEGDVNDVISNEPAYKFFRKLLDNFAENIESSINDSQYEWIKSVFENLPINIYHDEIYIEYKKIIDWCVVSNFIHATNFNQIIDEVLENAGINEDNYYDYYNNNVDYDPVNKQISKDLKEIKDEIENDDELVNIIENKKSFEKLIDDLGFKNSYGNLYDLNKSEFKIRITKTDFSENKVYIKYTNNKNKKSYEGWIEIDDLPRYSTMEMLFEDYKIRSLIRNILNKDLK